MTTPPASPGIRAPDLRQRSWGGQDLNLRPTDYESVTGHAGDLRRRPGNGPDLGVCLIPTSREVTGIRGIWRILGGLALSFGNASHAWNHHGR